MPVSGVLRRFCIIMRAAAVGAGALAADAGGGWFFLGGKRAMRIARVYGIIKRTIPKKEAPAMRKPPIFLDKPIAGAIIRQTDRQTDRQR